MDLLVETLRVVREIRDWANTRTRRTAGAERTRLALERAVEVTRRNVEADAEAPALPPLGPPAQEQPSSAEPLFDESDLDPHAVSAVRRLRRHGYAAYLVGGCVRDLLLGFPPKDFDVSTDARPEEIKSLFRNSRIIGRRFKLVHLYFRGGKIIEVSTFRSQARVDDEEDLLIRRDNVFGTEEEDALRRDFTINGLFYDVARGRIIDHVGGLEDVQQRYLRMIGDPDIRLREDPVRILRAVRFAAKGDLDVDPDLRASIETHRADLSRCAPARLLEEFLKLLRAGYAAKTFELLEEWSILEILLPELQDYFRGILPLEGPAGGSGEQNRERVLAHLRALDEVARRGPVDDCVVFGALLFAPIDDLRRNAEARQLDRNRAVAEFISSIGTHVTLTKRLSENLRQILGSQRHLEPGKPSRRRRKTSPSALMQRPFFPGALQLFEIRQRALGAPLDQVVAWQARAMRERIDVGPVLPEAEREAKSTRREPEAERDDGGATSPKRRKRRRSGRRGKRSATGDSGDGSRAERAAGQGGRQPADDAE
jgi:poly(A) polymerase